MQTSEADAIRLRKIVIDIIGSRPLSHGSRKSPAASEGQPCGAPAPAMALEFIGPAAYLPNPR